MTDQRTHGVEHRTIHTGPEGGTPDAVMQKRFVGRVLRAWALPWPAKKRAVRAGGWLLLTGVGLRWLGFARTQHLLERLARVPRGANTDFDREAAAVDTAQECAAVARAAHLVPGGTCLARALTLWVLLHQRGIATVLKVGIRRHRDTLTAHAWLEAGGVALPATEEVARYRAFRQPLIPGSRGTES